MIDESKLAFWKWYYGNHFILRMQADSFIMVIEKSTRDYHNMYATDHPDAKDLLKDIAKCMDKHPSIQD